MFEVITPYLNTILVALATGVLSVVAYIKFFVKTAVSNISAEEAEHIALEAITAMGDGVMSPEERKTIIIDAINACKSK